MIHFVKSFGEINGTDVNKATIIKVVFDSLTQRIYCVYAASTFFDTERIEQNDCFAVKPLISAV